LLSSWADSAPACLDAAVLAAKALGDASIEALNVVVDPDRIHASSDEIQFQRMRERDEGTAQERADAAHAAFVAWNAGAGEDTPRVFWRSVVGTEEAVVTSEAANVDALIVVAREQSMDSGDAIHAALFSTDKPVLIVPPHWRPGAVTAFSHMAVGLSDSDTAPPCDQGGGTMVAGGKPGHRDPHRRGWRSGAEARGAARRTVRDARTSCRPRQGDNLGAQLVAEAKAVGADLLVTGAYRHNQLVEWFMGGTTRHLLAAAEIPLLMAH
jgi:hypothetical protein